MTTTRGRPGRTRFALLGLLLAVVMPATYAQQPMGPRGPGAPMPMHGGPGAQRGGLEPLLPPFIALSGDQEDKLFELRHGQEPAMRKQMKELHDAHAQLRMVALADNYDEARARQAATRVSQASTELALMRARLQHAAFALLTPDQRKRLEQCKPGADGAPPPAECMGPPR